MLTHKLRRRVTRFGERPRDIRQAGFLLEGKPITYEDLRFERALAYNLDISNEIVVGTPKVIERNSSSLSSYSSSDQNKKLLKRPRNKKSKKKAKNTWAEDEAVAKELQRFNNEFDEIDDFQLLTEEAPRDFYVIKKRKRTTPKELQQINEPVVTAESSLFFSKQDSTQFTLNDTPLPPQQQQEENLSANISDENEIVPESPILNNSPIFKDIQEQQQFASISLKSPTLLEETTQKTIPPQVFTLDSTESDGIVQNVDGQSLSTAKEASQNSTEKSSIVCSSSNLLPPKKIFSSICEEEGNAVVDVIQLDSASSIQQTSSKIQTRSMAKESSKICSSSNLLPKRIFSSISGSMQDKEEEVIQLDSSIKQQSSSINKSLSTAKESSKNVAQESSAISSITNLLPPQRIFSSINEEEEESREVIQLEDTSSIVQSKFNVFDSMRESHHQTSLSLNTAKSPSHMEENIPRDETVPLSFASRKNLSQKIFSTSRVQQEQKSSEKSSSFNLEVEVVEEGEYVLDEEENEVEKEEEEMEEGEDEVNDEEEMEEQEVEMEENEEEIEAGENEEEVELEDEEKDVECQEPSKSVEIQLVSTAKESSKNLSRKSSKLSSNMPSKRIFSSIFEEVEEGQNVMDSDSSIQQQSCSRIQQSLSTAKEASSIYQKSSLNTAKSISSQLIGKEAISKSRGQRIVENIPRDETVPHSLASKKNLSQKDFSTSQGQQEHKSSEKSSSFNLEVEVVEGEYVLDEEENVVEEQGAEMEEGEDELKDEEEEEMEDQEVEMEENEEEIEAGENEVNDKEEEVNDEEEEVEDDEKEVECHEVEIEELEEDVIQLDSVSSIQQQSCSRIQQSLSTAKEASSIHQKSSLNTAKNISSQPIEKEAISKSLGQRSSNKLSSSTMPYIFSPKTLQKSQPICDASRTQKSVEILEGIEGTSKSGEKSFSTAKEISTRSKVQSHSKILSTRNLEELENTPPPSTSQQQHQPRQRAVEHLNRNASIRNSRRLSLSPWRQPQEFTHVLQHCNNGYIMTWDEFLDRTNFECIRKLGEGDYGEVYEMSDSKGTYAMKVIQVTEENPIPAVFSEVFITRHLSELNNAGDFSTPSYIPLVRANVVKGIYPDILIKAWKKYKKQNPKIALNKQPTERKDNTYVVLVMANGGVDLELYLHIPRKATKKQRFSIFYQVALSLAIAEERYSFEHRDLHYSNILISEVTTRERERRDKICYYYNGEKIEVRSHGVHASLIDFNNSRMTDDVTRQSVFVKFAVKPYKKGDDYQFKIYPMMKELNGDDWSTFHRKTNHYWLHYLYDKLFKDRRFTLKEREDFEKIFGRLVLKTEEGGFEITKDFLNNEEVREIFDSYVF